MKGRRGAEEDVKRLSGGGEIYTMVTWCILRCASKKKTARRRPVFTHGAVDAGAIPHRHANKYVNSRRPCQPMASIRSGAVERND